MKDNNINVVLENKIKCFGCNACYNVCPVDAISMKSDEEGFLFPEIDQNKCTNCGLCKNVCPALEKSDKYKTNKFDPPCYAIMADDEIRAVSSSGGAFTLIANWVLEQGGYVCGAAFDENGKVEHIIVDNKEDLQKLRGSKYVQSDMNTIHRQIKDLLAKDKKVLFSGTPCQVAGINNYIGSNDNLITVDLLCHGVPSPMIWEKYLKEEHGDDKFINANFREKILPWGHQLNLVIKKEKSLYNKVAFRDSFFTSFLKNICLRKACSECKFATSKREADITIADFWAIARFDKKLNDGFGTSLLLTNSNNAIKIFKSIKHKMKTCKKVPIEYAKHYNITLYTPLKPHPNRSAFFKKISQGLPLEEVKNYCVKNSYDCAIMGYWSVQNYGSSITLFALQNAINSIGYNAKIINFYNKKNDKIKNSFSKKFAYEYLNLTNPCDKFKDLHRLNHETETFIIGSDCMWRPIYFNGVCKEYPHFLSFCAPDKKKISYATSFGTHDDYYVAQDFYQMKYYLEKFDKISVREKFAVDFCKEKFELDAVQNPDPVFLIDKSMYANLAKKSTVKKNKPYIATYLICEGLKPKILCDKLAKKYNYDLLNLFDNQNIGVEEWLYGIMNCELFVTHSFHGLCFALIFNKPFIVYQVPGFDEHRYKSLLSILGLENRLLVDLDDIENREDIFEPIDWDKVNSILAAEKERGLKWLKEAIEAPKDLSKVKPEDALIKLYRDKLSILDDKVSELEQKLDKKSLLDKIKNLFKK